MSVTVTNEGSICVLTVSGEFVGDDVKEFRELAQRRISDDGRDFIVDMSEATVDTLTYSTFDDVGKPEPYTDSNANGSYDNGEPYTDINGNSQWDNDMGAAGLGGPGDIVVYRVSYQWGMITPMLEPIIGQITHTSSVVVRNEPY